MDIEADPVEIRTCDGLNQDGRELYLTLARPNLADEVLVGDSDPTIPPLALPTLNQIVDNDVLSTSGSRAALHYRAKIAVEGQSRHLAEIGHTHLRKRNSTGLPNYTFTSPRRGRTGRNNRSKEKCDNQDEYLEQLAN
ncbi:MULTISPECIES: hypothetical protein [Streptomyces]|uniref:hypothetical protein n=1 Tax=Streptomyces TaxID=1883 RepID=UPI00131B1B9E|nr:MULTISPECIES: hypothetical protein [Streptomyces]QNE26982.1 hypothetical protein F1D59_21255 [Streptomyces sp. INR7]